MNLSNLSLTKDNLKFLETLKVGNPGYIIKEELYYETIYSVTNLKYPNKSFILKKNQLIESDKNNLNILVDSLRSIQNLIISECNYSNNFICYNSLFLTLEQKKLFLNYVYEEAIGIEIGDIWPYKNIGSIDFSLLVLIAHRLFSNLAILHKYKIYHRDIKPENIIYNGDGTCLNFLKLIDFDFSCKNNLCGGGPGTALYAPFDIIFNDAKGIDWEKADIKSALITIIKIYTSSYDDFFYVEVNGKYTDILRKDIIHSLIWATCGFRKIKKVNNYTNIEWVFMKFLLELLAGNENLNAIYILRNMEKIFKNCIPKEIIII